MNDAWELEGQDAVGHFCVSLPGSADAMIRLNENVKLDWQFKNFMDSISQEEMEESCY